MYSLVLNTIFVAAAVAVPTSKKDQDDQDNRNTVFVPPTLAYCHDSECFSTGGAAVMTPGECMPASSGSSWGGFGGVGISGGLGLGGSSFWRRNSDDEDKDDKKHKHKHDKDDGDDHDDNDKDDYDQHVIVAYPQVGQDQQNCPSKFYIPHPLPLSLPTSEKR